MSFFETSDGCRLFYEEEGDGDPIVFAHEFGGDWRSWNAQVDEFREGYRCVRYCARGFLPSQVPGSLEGYGQRRSTDDLRELVDHLSLDRFHLVGLSMGSYTSLRFAMVQGGRLASLSLLGCSSGASGDAARDRYRADISREIALLDTAFGDGAVQWFSEDAAYARMPVKQRESWRRYCENLRAQSVDGARNTLRTLHWFRDSLFEMGSRIEAVSVPTMLVFGDEDHHLIRPTNEFLAERLPRCHVVEFEGTGHLVNLEDPRRFNEVLQAHLAGNPLWILNNP